MAGPRQAVCWVLEMNEHNPPGACVWGESYDWEDRYIQILLGIVPEKQFGATYVMPPLFAQ